MSEQAFRIEITGNIKVYIPIKKQAEVIQLDEDHLAWDQYHYMRYDEAA